MKCGWNFKFNTSGQPEEKTREKSEAVTVACNFIKKETSPQVFPVNFAKFLRITFSNRTPPVAASER